MRNSIKKIALGLAAISAFALTACMSSGSKIAGPTLDDEAGFGTVVVSAGTKSLSSLSKPGLAKGAAISLQNLVVTATAVNGDTAALVIDTIDNNPLPDTYDTTVVYDIDTVVITLTANTENIINGDTITSFVDSVLDDQTVAFKMNLKALRTWKISAKTIDVNDSVIHESDTVTVTNLLAGQVRTVSLNADPLFDMYKATFNFPDSIYSPSGLFGQKLNISKIELLVDSVVIASQTASFLPDTDYSISYDYVSLDADEVTLKVYGYLPTSDSTWSSVENVLYSKTRAISSLSNSTLNTVSLDWVGPVDGAAAVTVEIGRVGLYDIDGVTDPIVLD